IAEVVRDLHRAENQPEQSYSERQLYESALDRMAREVAAIERIDHDAAIGILNKSLIKAVAAYDHLYLRSAETPGIRRAFSFAPWPRPEQPPPEISRWG